MPVNMDPAKKRRKNQAETLPQQEQVAEPTQPVPRAFGENTASDLEKDLADAEWKNLWDATEVIDMDKI